jgi:hypothetical protein
MSFFKPILHHTFSVISVTQELAALQQSLATPPSAERQAERATAIANGADEAKAMYSKGSRDEKRPFRGFNVPAGAVSAHLAFPGQFPPFQVFQLCSFLFRLHWLTCRCGCL